MVRRSLAVLVGAVAMAALVAMAMRTVAPQGNAFRSPATPATTSQEVPTSAQPSAQPVARSAAQAQARAFAVAYLTYDWQRPTAQLDAIRPLSSPRLYASLAQAGITPAGVRVPWSSARPDIHETDAVDITGISTQWTSASWVSVQLQVTGHYHTDVGSSDTPNELDLALSQQPGGPWLVEWVSERPQTS